MALPPDFTPDEVAFYARVQPYTMTSPERILSLRYAIHYLARRGIVGAIVECGVWKGGSAIAALLACEECHWPTPDVWLYDTFNGMTRSLEGEAYGVDGHPLEQGDLACSLHTVRANIQRFYAGPVRYVRGPVESTIPAKVPDQIALLRLDTDWYRSTKHELTHLFPRVVVGGVVIIDDYGHWEGARHAVDEYWAEHQPHMLLIRVDYTGRMGVKLA
jgi:hypothetical protein